MSVLSNNERLRQIADALEDLHSIKDPELLYFLKTEFATIAARKNIREEVDSALLEDGRLDVVIDRIKAIALI